MCTVQPGNPTATLKARTPALPPMPSITDVKRRHEAAILKVDGVVGVGIGLRGGRECITVMVRTLSDPVRAAVPKEIEGFPTAIEVVGDVRARR